MPPAARMFDMHVCPLTAPAGGPIAAGDPTVLIGFMPAARVGDGALCAGPPDLIITGSFTVFIGGMPAARVGDLTANAGAIVLGCPTVWIGDIGLGGADGAAGTIPAGGGVLPAAGGVCS